MNNRKRLRIYLAAVVCCGLFGAILSGCKGDETKSGPGGNGLTPQERKAKKGDE